VLACTACDAQTVTIAPTTGGASFSTRVPTLGSSTSAPRHSRSAATLVIASGVTTLVVGAGDLGDDLFHATVSSGELVGAIIGDVVTMTTAGSSGNPVVADITINSLLTWSVQVAGGATEASVDLSRVHTQSVEFTSGVSSIELRLAAARGTTRVVMAGGASRFQVRLSGPAPVRVTLAGGAGSVDIDGHQRSGIAGGTAITGNGWTTASNRFDILCSAGVSSLSVERTA
jgi:hypothetical protein